jgi:hypothetical protein
VRDTPLGYDPLQAAIHLGDENLGLAVTLVDPRYDPSVRGVRNGHVVDRLLAVGQHSLTTLLAVRGDQSDENLWYLLLESRPPEKRHLRSVRRRCQ